MKPRQQRMLAVGMAAVGVIIATALTLQAFQENVQPPYVRPLAEGADPVEKKDNPPAGPGDVVVATTAADSGNGENRISASATMKNASAGTTLSGRVSSCGTSVVTTTKSRSFLRLSRFCQVL